MKFFTTVSVLAVAAGVSAQSPTVGPGVQPTSDCSADYIVTACIEGETPKVQACDQSNYACLCTAYKDVLSCYNNCPHDSRISAAQSQVVSYCNAASLVASKSTTSTSSSSSSFSSSSSTSTTLSSATKSQEDLTSAAASKPSAPASAPAGSSPAASSPHASKTTAAKPTESHPTTNGVAALTANGFFAAIGVIAALL